MGGRLQALELCGRAPRRRGGPMSSLREKGNSAVLQGIYNISPDLTREGGSIPVTLTFAESLGVNVLLLPMGRGDDGAQ